MNNWLGLGIQTFDASGNFSFTSDIPPENSENYYGLRLLSSGPVVAPDIVSHPSNLAIAAGNAANFSVMATGTDLTYRWYFNTNTLLASGPNSTLSIPNAQTNQSGKISVTVSNLVGITNSEFATLTVTNAPPPVAPPVTVANFGFETPTTSDYIYNPEWRFVDIFHKFGCHCQQQHVHLGDS